MKTVLLDTISKHRGKPVTMVGRRAQARSLDLPNTKHYVKFFLDEMRLVSVILPADFICSLRAQLALGMEGKQSPCRDRTDQTSGTLIEFQGSDRRVLFRFPWKHRTQGLTCHCAATWRWSVDGTRTTGVLCFVRVGTSARGTTFPKAACLEVTFGSTVLETDLTHWNIILLHHCHTLTSVTRHAGCETSIGNRWRN
jgi:hypothetical protein